MKKVIIILSLVVVLVALPFVYPFEKPAKETFPTMNDRGMCLQGIYPHNDFVLQESKAGEYKYEIYATQRGVEVWIECGKN